MLLAALGATVIGFVLLIVALVTGTLWLAIACVVVSVAGVLLLLGDVLTYRRGDREVSSGKDDGAARAWSPSSGDADDDGDHDADAPSDADEAEATVDDAQREAATVGNEDFGHHDGVPSAAPSEAIGWDHESPADTDDDSTRGLFAPGTYDPDLTVQIPQIRADQAWGTEWTPARQPESDDEPDEK